MSLFTVEERDRVRDRILELAQDDERVVAGAVIGSLAFDGDRWSDLDLTFAVADGLSVIGVLDDWTRKIVSDFDGAVLFDLPSASSIYRVFLLPRCLELDLSFAPASAFGATGPSFRLLFGEAVDKPHIPQRDAAELFGYAVHHALHARVSVERGRHWQAEYWISAVRDYALSLACRRRGLPTNEARGVDELPADVRNVVAAGLVKSLEREELLRALGVAIDGLLHEAEDVPELAARVEPQLRRLVA